MKRTSPRLAEVQVAGPHSLTPPPFPSASGPGAGFLVHLPQGASVAVPAGFDADEVFLLLTVVREALQ